MIALRPGAEQNAMVEVNYCQKRDGTTLETLVQDLHLCASMEFLLTVANIFRNAMEQGFQQATPQPRSTSSAKSSNPSVQAKESRESRRPLTDEQDNTFIHKASFLSLTSSSPAAPVMASKTEMNVLVKNPEIVFVADLSRADAPALVMTTQCEVVMKSDAECSQMTAVIKDLKVCVFSYANFYFNCWSGIFKLVVLIFF